MRELHLICLQIRLVHDDVRVRAAKNEAAAKCLPSWLGRSGMIEDGRELDLGVDGLAVGAGVWALVHGPSVRIIQYGKNTPGWRYLYPNFLGESV